MWIHKSLSYYDIVVSCEGHSTSKAKPLWGTKDKVTDTLQIVQCGVGGGGGRGGRAASHCWLWVSNLGGS